MDINEHGDTIVSKDKRTAPDAVTSWSDRLMSNAAFWRLLAFATAMVFIVVFGNLGIAYLYVGVAVLGVLIPFFVTMNELKKSRDKKNDESHP